MSSSTAADTDAQTQRDDDSNEAASQDEDDEEDSSGMNDMDLMSLDSAHVKQHYIHHMLSCHTKCHSLFIRLGTARKVDTSLHSAAHERQVSVDERTGVRALPARARLQTGRD